MYFYEDYFHKVHTGLLIQEIRWLHFIRETSIFRTKECFSSVNLDITLALTAIRFTQS